VSTARRCRQSGGGRKQEGEGEALGHGSHVLLFLGFAGVVMNW
jgi:hypothetical protein